MAPLNILCPDGDYTTTCTLFGYNRATVDMRQGQRPQTKPIAGG